MKMENIIVTTQRLRITPRSQEEIAQLIAAEADPHMKQAYGEMLALMQNLPGQEEWGSDWKIMLPDNTVIGGIGFKGSPNSLGTVEIGYGIDPPYQNRGFATEATLGMVEWAFAQSGVQTVVAQTEAGNLPSQKVLLKAGFLRNGDGAEGPLYQIMR